MLMKILLPVWTIILAIGFCLIPADRATAQTLTVLRRFVVSDLTNGGGYYPRGKLVANATGNILYGTLNRGGSGYYGTVFAINADGTGYTNLHNFVTYTNGTQPMGGVILSGNTLYGTAWVGGAAGNGAVFQINTDGTGYTNLHKFTATAGPVPFATNSDGAKPVAGLLLSSNRLYGTAEYGGGAGNGTVFALNTNGTGFMTVHHFAAGAEESIFGSYTNSGGIRPRGGLVVSGNTLYGTASGGGSYARGTVFKVNSDGSGFTTLHNFTRADYHPVLNPFSGNGDGANPMATLVVSGNTLYGTTEAGGYFGQGTVFKVNTDGTDFTTLHSFSFRSDGFYANAGLFLSGNTLYGSALGGGRHGNGTLFAINTDGSGFMNLHDFNADDDGSEPDALTLVGDSLYGMARNYGSPEYTDSGTVFRLSFAPQLTIDCSETDVVLTWPTKVAGFDYSGFTLQSATNLASPTWISNSLAPTVISGRYTVTNPASEPQQFFRLGP